MMQGLGGQQQQPYGQVAPQGFFGDILGSVGAPLGQAVGGFFGNPQLGGQLGGLAGQFGQQFLPFQAGVSAAGPYR
jgi:hypothetical protein